MLRSHLFDLDSDYRSHGTTIYARSYFVCEYLKQSVKISILERSATPGFDYLKISHCLISR